MIVPHDQALTCAGCLRTIKLNRNALVVTRSPATPYHVATVHDDIECLEAFRTHNPGWHSRREVLETVGWWRAGGVELAPFRFWGDRGHANLVVLESESA